MTIIEQIIVLLNLGIGIALCGLIFGKLYPRARRESLQQDLFAIRNDLFVFMRRNRHSFDEPAYRELRSNLNNSIRYCESFSMPNLILFALFKRNEISVHEDKIDEVEDEELKSYLKAVERKLSLRIFAFMLTSIHAGPCIAILLVVAALRAGTKIAFTSIVRIVKNSMDLTSAVDVPMATIAANLKPVAAFTYCAQHDPNPRTLNSNGAEYCMH